jgi:thioredoxin reductase (NADPH)
MKDWVMNNDHSYDVAIIGAGPCGMYASFVVSMLGLRACIIEKSNIIGGQPSHLYAEKPIYDIPGYPQIQANELIHNLTSQMKKFHVHQYSDEDIIKIHKNDIYFAISTNRHAISARAIILAIGEGAIEPKRIEVDNAHELERKGYIQYSMHNKDMFQDKSVAIAGGGDAAADWAITLVDIASDVSIIHRRGSLRCMDSLQHELNELQNDERIHMLLNTSITELHEVNNQIEVTSEHNAKKTQKQYDYLIVCYGSNANKAIMSTFHQDIKPKTTSSDEILIDPHTGCTSVDGVYAVGDCVGYETHNRPKIIALGFGEANTAAYHIRKHVFSHKVYNFTHSTSMDH